MLVIALVSKTVMPVRVPTGQVFSHKLGVFATRVVRDQAVLSSIHQMWADQVRVDAGSSPRYSPSDVFETFPAPDADGAAERSARTLDDERREIMCAGSLA